MNDMFDSMLEGVPSNISIKKLKTTKMLSNPVLHRGKTFDNTINSITFMVDTYLMERQITLLSFSIEKLNIHNYQILYPLNIELREDDKTAIYKKYINYKFNNLSEYIPKWGKIISFGKCLYTICESTDLDCSKIVEEDSTSSDKKADKNSIVQGFYDNILWKTYFFDPQLKSYIFPVDSWIDLLSKHTGVWAENFEVWFFKKQISLCKSFINKPLKIRKLNLIKVENPNEWLEERTLDKSIIAIDTETKGLDCFNKDGKVICVTISYDGYTGHYLNADNIDNSILNEYLKGRDLILTNGKFDIKWLHLHKDTLLSNLNMVSDTIPLQQLCNEMHRKGLKGGAFLHTYYGGYDKELDIYLENHPEVDNDYSLIPEDVLFPYATTDACITFQIHEALTKYRNELDTLLNKDNKYGYNLKYCYEEIMIPSINIFIESELFGINVDRNILDKTSEDLQKEIIEVQNEIKNIVSPNNKSFNVNSNDELGKALEENLGLPIVDRNAKGLPNVGESQLKAWSKEGYNIANRILYYREISKNFSTFVGMEDTSKMGSILGDFDEQDFMFSEQTSIKKKKIKKGKSGVYKYLKDDNKIHGNFALFSANSLRSRSFLPNLQQIPSHGDKAKIARKFFMPPTKKHAFLSTDLSGIQLRIGAILSQDPIMRDVFISKGGNLHLMTAMSSIPFLEPSITTFEQANSVLKEKDNEKASIVKDFRFKAKAVNFLCIFNGSVSVLSDQSILPDWSEESMDKFIEANCLEDRLEELNYKVLEGTFYYVKSYLSDDNKRIYTKAYVVAEDIHTKFFSMYQGLKNWIDTTIDLAKKQGYIVNTNGVIRRLPYLLFTNMDSEDVNKKIIKNLSNISLNTQAQTLESFWINRSIVGAVREMKEKGILSSYDKNNKDCKGGYIFGLIHDAIETITDLDNAEEQVKIIHKWFCKEYPEYEGIPIECESNIACTYQNGDLWDMGIEVTPKSVGELLTSLKP